MLLRKHFVEFNTQCTWPASVHYFCYSVNEEKDAVAESSMVCQLAFLHSASNRTARSRLIAHAELHWALCDGIAKPEAVNDMLRAHGNCSICLRAAEVE